MFCFFVYYTFISSHKNIEIESWFIIISHHAHTLHEIHKKMKESDITSTRPMERQGVCISNRYRILKRELQMTKRKPDHFPNHYDKAAVGKKGGTSCKKKTRPKVQLHTISRQRNLVETIQP